MKLFLSITILIIFSVIFGLFNKPIICGFAEGGIDCPNVSIMVPISGIMIILSLLYISLLIVIALVQHFVRKESRKSAYNNKKAISFTLSIISFFIFFHKIVYSLSYFLDMIGFHIEKYLIMTIIILAILFGMFYALYSLIYYFVNMISISDTLKIIIVTSILLLMIIGIKVFLVTNTSSYQYDRAIKTQDFNRCLKINDKFVMSNCLRSFAIANNDRSKCLTDNTLSNLCLLDVAKYNGDYSNCNIETGWVQDACFFYASLYHQDITICNNIQDEDYLAKCLGVLEKDIDFCNSIEGEYEVHRCYGYLAFTHKDLNFCNKISEGFGVYSECFESLGILLNDVNSCKKSDSNLCENTVTLKSFN